MTTFENPIIPGSHPDPSICRVGGDYYLATSSFEYFPGVPIFYSRDLVHWRPIGHALTRPSQLDLEGIRSSHGIFAPTLRFHEGCFYLITTLVGGRGHFFVSTDDPAGEWSEPVGVPGPQFDPDLFWDRDGTCWFTRNDWERGGIVTQRIELERGELCGETYLIFTGIEDRYVEAPHLYLRDGWYYLLAAEGGTHRGHMIVIARSRAVTGPYESCPHNPILTHRHRVTHPIQATGHGDLVPALDGSWWLVFLGIRQVMGMMAGYHHLGRETFLAPVTWTGDGWPVVNGGEPVELTMPAPALVPHPWPADPLRDDFDSDRLRLYWNVIRNPAAGAWSLTDRPGHLTLRCLPVTLDDGSAPAFVGRRQEHFDCRVAARIDFEPAAEHEEAGLTAFMNETHHYDLAVTRRDGRKTVLVRRRIGDLSAVTAGIPAPPGPVVLEIAADRQNYTFGLRLAAGLRTLATGQCRWLSSEVAGGFTGVYLGPYAAAQDQGSTNAAHFDWFDYVV